VEGMADEENGGNDGVVKQMQEIKEDPETIFNTI